MNFRAFRKYSFSFFRTYIRVITNAFTGLCYNELECLAGGGSITGYCAPAALGVCCVFRHKGCGRTIKQKISYFTNPNYPLQDRKPIACLLKGRHI